jgi:hypothetical protein
MCRWMHKSGTGWGYHIFGSAQEEPSGPSRERNQHLSWKQLACLTNDIELLAARRELKFIQPGLIHLEIPSSNGHVQGRQAM